MCCRFGSEHIRLLLSCIFPLRSLHVLASTSLIVVIGFGLGGIGCWAIVLGSLGGPPGEIVGDIVFVARAKTY